MKLSYNILAILILSITMSTRIVSGEDYKPPQVETEFFSKQFSDRELKEMIAIHNTRSVSTADLHRIVNRLFDAFSREGYPLARLDSIEWRGADRRKANLYFSDGERMIIGDSHVSGYNTDINGLPTGVALSELRVIDRAIKVLDDLTNNGYPFARVKLRPHDIDFLDEQLTAGIDFQIITGPYVRIGKVMFPGRKFTTGKFLRLSSRLKRGRLFRRLDADRAVRYIEQLEFIDHTGPISLRKSSPGVVDILIPVSEQKVNYFSGVLAVAPQSESPTGELNIQFGNILGTGRRLEFSWNGINPHRRGIRAAYFEPWLFGKPVHGSISFEQWDEDTLSTITDYRIGINWEPTAHLNVFSSSAYESIIRKEITVSDSDLRTYWFEIGGTLDYRDHRWNPSNGYRLTVSSSVGSRKSAGISQNNSQVRRDEIAVVGLYPLSRQFVAYGKLAARDISGEAVAVEDMVRLGGAGTVRGYAEDISAGRGAGWGNIELRWRPDRTGFLGLFIDGGAIYRTDARARIDDKTMLSSGLTGGFTTRSGRIKIDVGLANGEPINRARLHIRLQGWF